VKKNILFSRNVSAGILIALMIPIVPVLAADYAVEVQTGDWIKYEVTGTVPSLSEYAWVKLEVKNVNGTEITTLLTAHFKDGREENYTLSWAVETGRQSWIIPADLKKGDVFPYANDFAVLNDTVTRTYAGAKRNVNLLNLSKYDVATEMVVYWDQATGVLLELFVNKSSPTESWAGGYKAIETNMWLPALQVAAELSSDTPTQGETVTLSVTVKDEAGNSVEGAEVSANVNGMIISLSDLGGGNYEGILEPSDLAVGAHSVVIAVEKAGYQSIQTSRTLIVRPSQLQVSIQLSTDTVTRGEVMTVSAKISDISGNKISGAIVTVYIGDKAIDLLDIGNGNYQLSLDTSDIKEGTYIVTVTAHKEGYLSADTSANLNVKAAPTETPSPLWSDRGYSNSYSSHTIALIQEKAYVINRLRKRSKSSII